MNLPENFDLVDELHDKAMDLSTTAYFSQRKKQNDIVDIQKMYLEAFKYEKAAAMLLVNNYEMEPTRSVYFRSAASLILSLPEISAENYEEGERMIAYGLAGQPHPEIAAELREVRQQLELKYQQQQWKKEYLSNGKAFEKEGMFTALDLNKRTFEFKVFRSVNLKGSYPIEMDEKMKDSTFRGIYVIKGKVNADNYQAVLSDVKLAKV